MSFSQQNHVFIDPENCGSSVGYYLHIEEYTPKDQKTKYSANGIIVMADCSHKIDWAFSSNEGDLDKIDVAIHMLQEFRKKFAEAQKTAAKLNK